MSATTTSTIASPLVSSVEPTSAVRNTLSLARRNLLHIKSNPELIVEMTLQPLMFLVLFVFVFGGAMAGSSQQYLQFALPGILVQAVAFLPFATAIGLNVDFQRGVIDRFRSLPIARSAVIGGRITADGVRIIWSIIIITTFGVILGFRFGGTAAAAFGAMLVALAFGLTMCWPMAYMGIKAKTTESVNTLGFMIILPLTFASSTFVPVTSMPKWLAKFAEWNPITSVVDTVRGLMLGGPVWVHLVRAVGWMILITAVFAPLAIGRYRKRL
jgi:ABC-2 type transport system permease protein/oleandomycin transport system permease protein